MPTSLSALLWLVGPLSTGVAHAATAVQTLAERIELLEWSDPERAARLIDAAATPAERPLLDVPMREVSGMVYADMHRDADVASTLAGLQSSAARGERSAAVAVQYIRAYALYQDGRYAAAAAELKSVDVESIRVPAEQYRLLMLRGGSLRGQRQAGAAAAAFRRALEIAQILEDDARSVHAMIALAAAYTDAEELDQAAEQLASAEALATGLGDEAVLAAVDGALADVAARRGNSATERHLRLSALDHARLAEGNTWLADALARLGGSYLQTRDFRESLKYTKMAAPLVAQSGGSHAASTVSLNEGLALVGLGNIKLGQAKAERAIADTVARDDVPDARDMLRQYAGALERSGYLMMAIQSYQRFGALGDQLLLNADGKTGGPSAAANEGVVPHQPGASGGDAELARPAATLPRQQLLVAIVLGVAGICATLVWAFARVKQADERVRLSSERDPLTGLWNRGHFNQRILPVAGEQPMIGCVLLADLDHVKRINDIWGHPAGDVVLKTVSDRLAEVFQDGDTVMVRWEGDAFLLQLGAVTAEQANQTAERLLDAVRKHPVQWNGQSIGCTVSIGYACFPLAGATTEITLVGAINLVDRALREAKRRGRDRACLISAIGGQAKRATNVAPGESATVESDRPIELREMGVAA